MAEKRMLIVDAEIVKKVDENRGDMSRSDFLNFLIDGQLQEDIGNQSYVSSEEFHQFAQGMKELLRNFLEFFLSYGLELGKQPQDIRLRLFQVFYLISPHPGVEPLIALVNDGLHRIGFVHVRHVGDDVHASRVGVVGAEIVDPQHQVAYLLGGAFACSDGSPGPEEGIVGGGKINL